MLYCSQLLHSVFYCFTLCFNFLQNINSSSQLNVFKTFYIGGADCAAWANGNFIVSGVLALPTITLVFMYCLSCVKQVHLPLLTFYNYWDVILK